MKTFKLHIPRSINHYQRRGEAILATISRNTHWLPSSQTLVLETSNEKFTQQDFINNVATVFKNHGLKLANITQ